MKKYDKPKLELTSFQSSKDIAEGGALTISNTLIQTNLSKISVKNIVNY